MISKIILYNFQRHKKLSVDLKDGFNCVMGSNNRGKSSLVRALYWLATNSPAGDWMCRRGRDGKKHTAVVKVLNDGHVIKRVKGNGQNYYTLDDQEYHEIGRAVPQDVANALGLGQVKLPGQNLNIEKEEDMPFLVYEAATVRASALNVLTGTDIIEKTIKELNRDRSNKSREINYVESEWESQVDMLEKYDPLEGIDFAKCDSLMGETAVVQGKIGELRELAKRHGEKLEIVQCYQYLKDAAKDFLEIERLIVDVTVGQNDLSALRSMASRAVSCKKFCKPSPVDFGKVAGALSSLEAKIADLDALRRLFDKVRGAGAAMKANKAIMASCNKELVGVACPTCGHRMKNGQVCFHN